LTCPRPFTTSNAPSPTSTTLLPSFSTFASRVHPIQLNAGRHSCLRRSLFVFPPKAISDQQGLTMILPSILNIIESLINKSYCIWSKNQPPLTQLSLIFRTRGILTIFFFLIFLMIFLHT
jgi:hypothetical protein